MGYVYVITSIPKPEDEDDGIDKWLDKYNDQDHVNLNEDITSRILDSEWDNMLITAAPEGTPEEQDAALLAGLHIDHDRR